MTALVLIAKINAFRADGAIAEVEQQEQILTEITVHVRGAVLEPAQLKMPVQSRICDLKSKISLASNADRTFFRRKKRLKNGEIIEVPKKTVE